MNQRANERSGRRSEGRVNEPAMPRARGERRDRARALPWSCGSLRPLPLSFPFRRYLARFNCNHGVFSAQIPDPLPVDPSREIIEEGVDHGHHQEGEDGGGDEAADDGAGHGGPHLRALPEGQGQGEHAEDHGEGGHHDGPQPGAARRDEGLAAVHAPALQDLGEVHEEDGVLGHEAHEHDEADEGHDVDRVPREEEHPRHAHDGEGQGEHDGERVDEGLELGRQDEVDEDDGQEEGFEHVPEGLLHGLRVAGHDDAVARGHGDLRAAAFMTSCAAVPSGRSVEVGGEHHLPGEVLAADLRRRGGPLDASPGRRGGPGRRCPSAPGTESRRSPTWRTSWRSASGRRTRTSTASPSSSS